MVARPRRGAGQHEDDAVGLHGRADRSLERDRVVADHTEDMRRDTLLAQAGGEHDAVGVHDLARLEPGAGHPQLVAGGDDRDGHLHAHRQRGVTDRRSQGQVVRAEALAGLDDDRARLDVLADGTHVRAGRDDVPHEDAVRIGAISSSGTIASQRRRRLPRVDGGVLAGLEHDRRERRRGGLHGDPVHRRTAVRRVGAQRRDVGRRDPAERVGERDVLHGGGLQGARAVEQRDPLRERDLGRGS